MGREHPDWLPMGWKVSVKVRACGRKDKYYVNPNGLKFNSKPDVLRYLKPSENESKAKATPNKVYVQTTVPKQLPPGWIKKIRTKKNGSKTRRDPYYIDPVSGRHFRSMPEVFRYLQSNDSGKAGTKMDCDKALVFEDHSQSSSSEAKGQRQRSTVKKADKILTGKKSVKSGRGLPSGSGIVAVVNKDNMPEEDNCLERGEEDKSLAIGLSHRLQLVNGVEQLTYRTREIKKLANNKVDKSVDGDQRIKSGPIVSESEQAAVIEATCVEKNVGKDDSVAELGNLLDKLPQTNGTEHSEVGRRRSRRLQNVIEDEALKSGEGAEKNKNMRETNGIKQRVKENGSIGEGVGCQQENPAPKRRKNLIDENPVRRTSKRLARIESEAEADTSLEIKTSEKAKAAAESEKQQTVGWDTKEDEKPQKHQIVVTDSKEDVKSKKHRNVGTCSKEDEKPEKHRNVGAASKEDVKLERHRNVGAVSKGDEKHQIAGAYSKKNVKPEKRQSVETDTKEHEKPEKHQNIGVTSKADEKPKKHQVSGASSMEDEKPEKQNIDSSLNDLLMDPCIEFAIKTLTGAIPIEDLNKASDSPVSSRWTSTNQTLATSSIAPDDIWADPCFEFAVKTLTSDVPAESGINLQISFQQPSSSGPGRSNVLDVPKFRLDNNYYPSDYSSSQFDAVKKPCVKQQGVRDPPSPHSVNGGVWNVSLHRGS